MFMYKQIAGLLSLSFALFGCVPGVAAPTRAASPTPAASLTPAATDTLTPPTATAVPGPTSTPVNAPIQTYHNAAVGFAVDYPEGWMIDATNEAWGTVILWSRKVDGPGTEGVPDDVAKIDLVNPALAVQSLDQLAAWQKAIIIDAGHAVLHEESLQLPSGLAAVQMHVSGIGESLVLLALINHRPLIIAGYGDLSRFEEVAQSLRPVPPTTGATPASRTRASIAGRIWHDECAMGG